MSPFCDTKWVTSRIDQHSKPLFSRLMGSQRRPSCQQFGFGLINVIDRDVEVQASRGLLIWPRGCGIARALKIKADSFAAIQDDKIGVRGTYLTTEKHSVEVRESHRIRTVDGNGEDSCSGTHLAERIR